MSQGHVPSGAAALAGARAGGEARQVTLPGTSAVTSAAARVGGAAFVSTVLPWPHAPAPPYVGATQAEQTERALDELEPWLTELARQGPLVRGGDWNHPLAGSLSGFSRRAQDRIALAVKRLGLTVHTRDAWAQAKPNGLCCRSVDHLASASAGLLDKHVDGSPHSTHGAYAVELPGLQPPQDGARYCTACERAEAPVPAAGKSRSTAPTRQSASRGPPGQRWIACTTCSSRTCGRVR